MEIDTIFNQDCLVGMQIIPDKSIDMILCDLPYGTTACKWDSIIPFEPLWAQYKRIIKDHGAIVLFGSEPFTSRLINSQLELFRYDLIWDKQKGCDFLNANRKPLKSHENILVFYKPPPGITSNIGIQHHTKRSMEIEFKPLVIMILTMLILKALTDEGILYQSYHFHEMGNAFTRPKNLLPFWNI